MKAVVAAFNQEKALVGAFSVITNLRMEPFQALETTHAALAPRIMSSAGRKFTPVHSALRNCRSNAQELSF